MLALIINIKLIVNFLQERVKFFINILYISLNNLMKLFKFSLILFYLILNIFLLLKIKFSNKNLK